MTSATQMAVLVVLVMVIALFAPLITAQQNSVEMSISANNSASNNGLVQLRFSFNASVAQRLDFSLKSTAPCPVADGLAFTKPSRGYQRLAPMSCFTERGHGYGFEVDSYEFSNCRLGFTFPHVDANTDVICWVQWAAPLENQASIVFDALYANGLYLTLAAPLVLTSPTNWATTSSQNWTLGELSVKYEKGAELWWEQAPKEMTKDKLIVHFKDANLEPYSQYKIWSLNMMRNGTAAANVLSLFKQYSIINAYVANDVRVLHDVTDLSILTGAKPATSFDLEFTFSKFLSEYSATQRYNLPWASNDTITFSAEIVRDARGDTRYGAIAESEPLEAFKYRELFPGLTNDPSTTLTAQSSEFLSFSTLYTFYPNAKNVTIDIATTGYAYGFANAAELFNYYGTTTKILYSCDQGVTWVDFDVANNKITGRCNSVSVDVPFSPSVRLVVPTGKLVKPFQIPITIDGITTAMEWVPMLSTDQQQPFTKHTNTGIEMSIASTYKTKLWLSGLDVGVDVDPNVMFTTPVVYQWDISHWHVMLKDSLDCKAYNGNAALTMTPHSFADSEQLFKDKKVVVRAKAGDTITMVCSTPINPNPKEDGAVVALRVHAMGQKSQRVEFYPDRSTKPIEGWLLADTSSTYVQGITGSFLFSPAPSTVEDAKKRIVKLLQTAKPIDQNKRQHLDVLKNKITTKHVIITGFLHTNHHYTKMSSFTAQDGLGKVFEFNTKMPSTWSFDGEDKRIIVGAVINTTTFKDLYAEYVQYQFTAANEEEHFNLSGEKSYELELIKQIDTFAFSKLEHTTPAAQSYLFDDAQCFTNMQCRCVKGRCSKRGENPLIWAVHDIMGSGSPWRDATALHNAIQDTKPDNQDNTAFSATSRYSFIVIAMVAIVATLF